MTAARNSSQHNASQYNGSQHNGSHDGVLHLDVPGSGTAEPALNGGEIDPTVHRYRWVTLGVLCLSLLIIVMDNTILNVAIPSLIRSLGASNREIQWVIDAYTLAFAGLLLTTGSLSDRFGRKGALQLGIVLFAIGSTASALTSTPNQLIFTRAFMGIGAALIMPSTLSILTNVFRDPTERARAIGVWAAFSGLGVALGPILGGLLLAHFSWHSVFWVNLPIGGTALVLGMFFVPTSRDPRQARLDPAGALLSILALGSLLFTIIEGPSLGWTSAPVLVAAVVAVAGFASFITWERRVDQPMLDVTVFANPRFTAASLTLTMVFFALFGSLFLMTQFWQLVQGYTALQAGVRLLPYALTIMVTAPTAARVVERIGTKRVVVGGLLLVSLGLGLLSTISPGSPYLMVIAFYIVMAAGMGLTMAPATESVMGALPRERAGVGSAINDTTRQIGGALGVAVIGSVVTTVYGGRIADLAARYQLDAPATDLAKASVGSAQEVGGSLGAQAGPFIAEANQAFVSSLSWGLRVGVLVLLGAAVVAFRYLPARAPR